MLKTIVGHIGGRCKGEWDEQKEWEDRPAGSVEIRVKIKAHLDRIYAFLEVRDDHRHFDEVERQFVPLIFALGRLFLAYFLARRHERSEREVAPWLKRGFRRREKPERKYLHTFFGRVCFWRAYVRRSRSVGLHPLDVALGLCADGFSLWMTETCARLSTFLSYEQVTAVLLYFLCWSPSKTSVEKSVLGLGRYTQQWFASAPPPKGDGEVLVIQIDSKATPTATEEELEKRRGKRVKGLRPLSPRHRGRAKRARRGPKKRRAPGDKSKNGKAATIVTMYTLKKGKDRDGNPVLLGPINKRVYASYAPKRHACAVARREADKRGFLDDSGKLVQIVTDGDEDLERYVKELFPKARHTVDIAHVLEYLWEAGRIIFKEGSEELVRWAKSQEGLLYRGKEVLVLQHVWDLRKQVVVGGREHIERIHNYLLKRIRLMDYHDLKSQDLEVASGAVEGAVRHVIAKRFDNGSMRWIKERAEPLLQLRCIEINGDWSDFVAFVAQQLRTKTMAEQGEARLLTTSIAPLPTFGINACYV